MIKDCLSDKEKEIKLMPLLDFFYEQTLEKENFLIERITAKDLQIRGVDIIITNKETGEKMFVDEKCAIRFFKRENQLKTYCFELFSKFNKNCDGWFCNNDFYKTTHYCLFYPIANNENLDIVEQLDMILIEKDKLWDIINKLGFKDKESLLDYFNAHKEVSDIRDYCKINNSIKMVQSKTFREKPINIIFNRSKLEELSYKKYTYKFNEVKYA